MKLLDLCCGAGGAAMGFHRAGFKVVGVDIAPQPRYPFEFIQADALEYFYKHWRRFDMFHAGPPCQKYSKSTQQWRALGREYPDMISEIRNAFIMTGNPYIIENVPGAPLINPIELNGVFFGLRVHRPRLFECYPEIKQPTMPPYPKPVKMGRPVGDGDYIQPVGHFSGVGYAQKQMSIDWMGQKDLAQAIPPAYTEWIVNQIMKLEATQ